MAIILHEKLRPSGEIGVWEIEDSTIELFERLELTDEEKVEIAEMSERRKKEWVAARWLIHKLSGRKIRGRCIKDSYGKPYLEGSHMNISISHSLDKVAVVASPYHVGVDIQEIVDKMERLAVKFLHPVREFWAFTLLDKHVLWGAKEAMYKAYGKKGIDFKDQMGVNPCVWQDSSIQSTGWLQKGNIKMNFDIQGQKVGNFVLMRAVEKSREVV